MSTWVEKLRGTSPPMNSFARSSPHGGSVSDLVSDGEAIVASMNAGGELQRALLARSSSSPACPQGMSSPCCTVSKLDTSTWVEVLQYVSFLDICRLGESCKGLWCLHLVDWVWYWQERYLLRDVWAARGTQLSTMEEISLVPRVQPAPDRRCAARYNRFKEVKVLLARDLRREFDFRDVTAGQYSDPRARTHFLLNPDFQEAGVLTRALTLDATGRVLKSELRIYDVARPGGSSALRPSQLLSACDDLAANVDGRFAVLETTNAQEDPQIVWRLQVGLSPRQAGDNMLHQLGPRVKLIEITREEAHMFEQQELAARHSEYSNLLEDFVIDAAHTRYFIGPELCRSGRRIGIIVVDTMRLLFVACRDE